LHFFLHVHSVVIALHYTRSLRVIFSSSGKAIACVNSP
jgi:hypothetical protein